MIEAVNATASNAPLLRGNAEQVDVAHALAANPDRIQQVRQLPQAPYISPYIFMDVNFDKAVLQIRDSDTGDVVGQFPSESRLALQAQTLSRPEPADVPDAPAASSSPAPSPAPQQVAEAQVAAAALARSAQAAQPQIATVITSA